MRRTVRRRARRLRRRVRRLVTGRVALVVTLVVLGAVAWSAWSVWRVQTELREAEAAFDDLVTSVGESDVAARDAAVERLRDRSGAAHRHSDGPWWALMGVTPVVGDDLRGIEAMAASLDAVATEGLPPLLDAVGRVGDGGVARGGRVDLSLVAALEEPVERSRAAFADALAEVEDVEPEGLVEPLRLRLDDYVTRVRLAERALTSAAAATRTLPRMLGQDGPRDYLLAFQNNAEIRATGGIPGSWLRVHAEDGLLTVEEQGSAGDFRDRADGAPYLTDDELALYGAPMGRYFQDVGFTPDFPRAAELMAGHFTDTYGRDLDGVVSVDPVALSYVLGGTGDVDVGAVTLDSDNVVEVLLREVYLRLPPSRQNDAFELVARDVFAAVTDEVPDPLALLLGIGRGAYEDRIRLAAFVEADRQAVGDSDVLGRLTGDARAVPHVDVTLDDATGAKMSYFLRHDADVRAIDCDGIGRQTLAGQLRLTQDVDQRLAAALPDYVTGGGRFGVAVGSQALVVRIYAPYAGSVESIAVDDVDQPIEATTYADRPVATASVVLTGRQTVDLSFTLRTGPGQSANGRVDVTPGVGPGDTDSTFASAC